MKIFMQMFRIRPRLTKLPRVLSAVEIEEGHFLPRRRKGNCGYRSMLNGWRGLYVYLNLFGGIFMCVLVSRDKCFCCVADLLFEIGILNSAL